MSVESMMTISATIYRRSEDATVDEYGNPVLVEGSGTPVFCQVTQRTARDLIENTETAIDQWRLFLPSNVEFSAGDRIVIDGLGSLEADGEPWPVWQPRLRKVHHLEATLRRVS